MSKSIDMEIKKIDHLRKEKDNKEIEIYKATLQNEFKDTKLTFKYDDKQALESTLGILKIGEKVQMKLENTQTKLDEHGGD